MRRRWDGTPGSATVGKREQRRFSPRGVVGESVCLPHRIILGFLVIVIFERSRSVSPRLFLLPRRPRGRVGSRAEGSRERR